MRKTTGHTNYKRSFGTKVCLLVLITAVAIFVLSFGIGLHFAGKRVLQEGHEKANLELSKAILYLEKNIVEVESSGRNFVSSYPKAAQLSPDSVFALCENFLNTNTKVQGMAIGFEPLAYPQYERGFSPYVMRNDSAYTRLILSDKREYRKAEWYRQTIDEGRARWSDPFKEMNGTIICSYCIPLIDAEGKAQGVVAIDIALTDLTEFVKTIKPYVNSQVSLLDRQMNYLACTEEERIANKQAIFNTVTQEQTESYGAITWDIQHRVSNQRVIYDKLSGQDFYVYYAPVTATGWTLVIDSQANDVLKGVFSLRNEMLLISAIGLLLMLLGVIAVMRKQVRPIKEFADAAKHIAGGNFHTVLPAIKEQNELWYLSRSLDEMQHSLEHYISDLKSTQKEKGRIESELKIASDIQLSMLPKIFPSYPDRSEIDIYASLTPAKEVGGDLYDFFIRDDKLFFCIGDVSGKGIPAALVMAVTRSLIRIVAAKEDDPAAIAASLNNSMADMNDSSMFVTLFVGVIDLTTGFLSYCNAGHNPPVIVGPENGNARLLNVVPNLPIAIMPAMKFEKQTVKIDSNTTIFLYTDGLTEAENNNKELFGEDRMLATINNLAGQTSRTQIAKMKEAVIGHVNGADQSDDLTMLSIKCMFDKTDKGCKRVHMAVFHNNIKDVPALSEFIDAIAKESDLDAMLTSNINLALEEVVANIMEYAYPKGSKGAIEVESTITNQQWRIVLTDSGVKFDPTLAKEADIGLSAEERPVGGLGIFLVRHIMDEVTYEYNNGKNILTLVKNIQS